MRTGLPPRTIRVGVEAIEAGVVLPRHQHFDAYATLILDGTYEQVGYGGRLIARAGDVIVQPTLDCHANRMLGPGARVLRLPWRRDASLGGLYRVETFDAVRRMAETDAEGASLMLQAAVAASGPAASPMGDWPDALVAAFSCEPGLKLGAWAERTGLARETVARGFGRAYGVAPARFRAELQARQAWLSITSGADPLAKVAADLGFSDQPHMTRAVGWLTGASPAEWRRRSRRFKTEAEPAARMAR